MTVEVRVTNDGLSLRGELDMAAADDFLRFAAESVDGSHEVVLDIADLAFLDSHGMRAISRLAASVCPNGLVLRWPRDNVQRALDIVSFEDIAGIRVERHEG